MSDGLSGIRDALLREFPKARHQSCWTHICRNVCKLIRQKDRKAVMDGLKRAYSQEDAAKAGQELDTFLEGYGTAYPRLRKMFEDRSSLFSFYSFPKCIRSRIYTSNLVENNNKWLKHKAKVKEQLAVPKRASLGLVPMRPLQRIQPEMFRAGTP